MSPLTLEEQLRLQALTRGEVPGKMSMPSPDAPVDADADLLTPLASQSEMESPTPVPDDTSGVRPEIREYLIQKGLLDVGPKVDAARQQADKGRLITNLGRATDMFAGALTHRPANSHAYDALDKQAALPESRAAEDIQLEKMAMAARQAMEKSDPASRRNRMAQEALAKAAPNLAKALGPALQNMTEEMIQKYIPIEHQKNTLDLQSKKYDHDVAQDAARMGLERDKLAEQKRLHDMMANGKNAGGLSPAQALVQDRFEQSALERLGKATTPLSDVSSVLAEAEQLAPGIVSGSVDPKAFPLSGFDKAALEYGPLGSGASLVKGFGGGDKAIALHNTLKNMADLIARNRTGAAMNKQEEALYKKLSNNEILSDPQATAIAVNEFAKLMHNKLKNAQSPFETGTIPVFDKFIGTKYNDPIFQKAIGQGAPTPAQGAPAASGDSQVVIIRRKKDGATRPVSAAAAQKFLSDPNYEVVPQ